MKTVSITLEDDLYEAAEAQAVRNRKSLGDFLRDVFVSGLRHGSAKTPSETTTLNALWQLADAHPLTPGSVGPLNREDCYERGLSRH
ncbi:MAG: hypothetical protein IAE77_26235 [Prosthecobacter sp.]|jgi:hypothetical protein|uniref:hypothetical protein n=1 Tax=Prosthecobacter sp. TaxID=1965333 RepID=UPI001A0D0F41|nr:hypothetical protein [Prosthecobacter sp.]MBE2286982.1 hypothetical protein [Prosthecobacter sp.]